MGRDNSPKQRQQRAHERKVNQRASYKRILIVSEGSKTEPNYFNEIRETYRLQTANVAIQPSQWGTEPIQVVEYAKKLFEEGDLEKGIRPRAFDEVYAVFDRDDHLTYWAALQKAEAFNGKLKNTDKQAIGFYAMVSIPSFELWLLLHYEDIQAPIHRDEVMRRLKTHFLNYQKNQANAFATTREWLPIAHQRAEALVQKFTAYTDPEPYTDIGRLVKTLSTLREVG